MPDNGPNVGLIVGALLGGLAAGFIIAGILFLLRKRLRGWPHGHSREQQDLSFDLGSRAKKRDYQVTHRPTPSDGVGMTPLLNIPVDYQDGGLEAVNRGHGFEHDRFVESLRRPRAPDHNGAQPMSPIPATTSPDSIQSPAVYPQPSYAAYTPRGSKTPSSTLSSASTRSYYSQQSASQTMYHNLEDTVPARPSPAPRLSLPDFQQPAMQTVFRNPTDHARPSSPSPPARFRASSIPALPLPDPTLFPLPAQPSDLEGPLARADTTVISSWLKDRAQRSGLPPPSRGSTTLTLARFEDAEPLANVLSAFAPPADAPMGSTYVKHTRSKRSVSSRARVPMTTLVESPDSPTLPPGDGSFAWRSAVGQDGGDDVDGGVAEFVQNRSKTAHVH